MVSTAVPDHIRVMPGASGASAAKFASVIASALQSGYRSAVEHSLRDGSHNPELHESVALVQAALATLDGEDPAATQPSGCDDLVRELFMTLPLLRTAHRRATTAELVALPVPAISGSRGALWRLVRSMLALATGDTLQHRRLVDLAAAYRNGSFLADCVQRRDVDDWSVWLVVMAQLGVLTRDRELCDIACTALADCLGEVAVLGSFIPVGPIGWFIAEPLALLGDLDQARSANQQAEQVSRSLRSAPWIARCRHQRFRLGFPDPRPVAAIPATTAVARIPTRDQPAGPAPSIFDRLTPRQLQILQLAAAGHTNAQIAKQLYVSIATVERHSTMTYRTLGVRNRAQALGLLARHRHG